MQTGENLQGLRQTMDFTRLLSLTILLIHFYCQCYLTFKEWGLTGKVFDLLIFHLLQMGIFNNAHSAKSAALLLLIISLLGTKGRKDQKIIPSTIISCIGIGLMLYYGSRLVFLIKAKMILASIVYMVSCLAGYLLLLRGGVLISRILKLKLTDDVFNKSNQAFPQEERFLCNEFSVNLPAEYFYKGAKHKSWINLINPFRGLLVSGTPGSGKSYFVIRHVITQHIKKGFAMLLYDFKYDDLSRIAYNTLLNNKSSFPITPEFYVINFDHLTHSHRCNPLHLESMNDITDAAEAARTIMLGLNREWIKRQGDFFVESPINFLTAVIWFLRKYKGGRYCTLPHAIELMLVDYERLFSLLKKEPEVEALINPFVSAYSSEALEQLEGQVGSAKITLARLSSPQLYYVLSGDDFTLDLNNPNAPKILCLANNPQKQQIYGTVLSLYVSTALRLINRKSQQKCSLVFDEFPTIFLNGVDSLIATARSNKVATTLGMQDLSQLRKEYGKEQADVIMNITGNIISGQVTGDSAKQLSERFGKILQQRESVSINSSDTSISRSVQLESAIPPSIISSLSSGEFVGMVTDDPEHPIELKMFHCHLLNDHKALRKEDTSFKEIPAFRSLSPEEILENYNNIKADVKAMLDK